MIQTIIVFITYASLVALIYYSFQNCDFKTKWQAIKSVISLTLFSYLLAEGVYLIAQGLT